MIIIGLSSRLPPLLGMFCNGWCHENSKELNNLPEDRGPTFPQEQTPWSSKIYVGELFRHK